MMEFWVRFSVAEHGLDDASGEAILTALDEMGLVDPLADQSLVDGRLSVGLWVEGADAQDAVDRGLPIFARAMHQAGLRMTRLIGLEVTAPAFEERTAPAA